MTERIYKEENNLRILLKAISWRVFGTLTTITATFTFTNSLNIATAVGAIEMISKIILFYVHEKIWIKINQKT